MKSSLDVLNNVFIGDGSMNLKTDKQKLPNLKKKKKKLSNMWYWEEKGRRMGQEKIFEVMKKDISSLISMSSKNILQIM